MNPSREQCVGSNQGIYPSFLLVTFITCHGNGVVIFRLAAHHELRNQVIAPSQAMTSYQHWTNKIGIFTCLTVLKGFFKKMYIIAYLNFLPREFKSENNDAFTLSDIAYILYHGRSIIYKCFYLNWLFENLNLFFSPIESFLGSLNWSFMFTMVYIEYHNVCSLTPIMILFVIKSAWSKINNNKVIYNIFSLPKYQ